MIPLQLEPFAVPKLAPGRSVVRGNRYSEQLDGVERALIESRSRILRALESELEAVRAIKASRSTNGSGKFHEVFQESPLPANVLPLSLDLFAAKELAPPEAALDPMLERATIDELNAALAAAFNQMSAS